MPRRGSRIVQADIARIVRGMRDAGVRNVRTVIRADGVYVEVDDREQDREAPSSTTAEPIAQPERIVPL